MVLGSPWPPPLSSCLLDLTIQELLHMSIHVYFCKPYGLGERTPFGNDVDHTFWSSYFNTHRGRTAFFYLPIYGTRAFAHATRSSSTAFSSGTDVTWVSPGPPCLYSIRTVWCRRGSEPLRYRWHRSLGGINYDSAFRLWGVSPMIPGM